MARCARPYWLYASLLVLLLLLLSLAWLAMDVHRHVPVTRHAVAPQPKVVYEDDQVSSTLRVMESPPHAVARHARGIALILDDAGYDLHAIHRVLSLPYPVAVSVIPDTPYARQAAELTHASGRTVMLHMPMEPANPKYQARMNAEFLRAGMSRKQVQHLLLGALRQVPYVAGINNHMGSLLTTMPKPMDWVMSVCRQKHLFFVDSRTSKDSVAAIEAKQARLSWGERRVFLDDGGMHDMELAWKAALRKMKREGVCIVIAHPHTDTLMFLEHHIPKRDQKLIVPLITLLHKGDVS
ncbi:MAG TPA: divergent polysaccharide deacetylase family protein [Mariprofundaceae bacterium]|nr:divergent polysaccharide deacetylase family protein [Mariprofundaceae bacterium]